MGRLFLIDLEGNKYTCKYCQTHLALSEHIISKSFECWSERDYLFDKVVNVTAGKKEDQMLMTGMHTVVDIICIGCGSIVGWKYVAAQEKLQRHKVGKFVLNSFQVLGPEGSNYSITQDTQMAGSDADDVN